MATGEDVGKIEKKDLSDLVTCPLCLEYYEKPKFLTCGHSLCRDCLQTYVDKTLDKGSFLCPICRSSINLPGNGLDGFNSSFFIVRLQDEYNKLPVNKLCDACRHDDKTTQATAKCIECAEYICEECTAAHRKTKLTRAHHVLALGEEPSVQDRQIIQETNQVKCRDHPDEAVRYFCTACQKLICRDCRALGHADHKAVAFTEAITGKREDGRTELVALQNKSSELSTTLDSISQDMLDLETNKVSITNSIVEKRDELIQLVTREAGKAVNHADRFMAAELKTKKADSEKLQFFISQINSHVSYSEMLLTNGSDVEVLDGIHLLKERGAQLVETETAFVSDHRFLALQPTGYLTTHDNVANHFHLDVERRQTPGDRVIIRSPRGQCFTGIVFHNDALYACAGGSLYKVEHRAQMVKPVNLVTHGRAYAISVLNGITVVSKKGRGQPVQLLIGDVTTAETQPISIVLPFTSDYPAVIFAGEVEGLPRYLVTEISPTSAVHLISCHGDVLKTYGMGILKYPYSVALNVDGVVIADWGLDDVIVFDSDGNVKRRLRQSNTLSSLQLSGPCGVCTNGEFIFVSSCRTHSILLFSYSGDFIKTILTKKDGLEYPEDLSASPYRCLAVVNKWRDEIRLYSYIDLLPVRGPEEK